ncbi:MAG: hypothetical protein R2751_10440 [Bacteroidales bacterium]
MILGYPLDDGHYYIQRLVQAGFGKRILYGTDFIMWPRMFETSIESSSILPFGGSEARHPFQQCRSFLPSQPGDFD